MRQNTIRRQNTVYRRRTGLDVRRLDAMLCVEYSAVHYEDKQPRGRAAAESRAARLNALTVALPFARVHSRALCPLPRPQEIDCWYVCARPAGQPASRNTSGDSIIRKHSARDATRIGIRMRTERNGTGRDALRYLKNWIPIAGTCGDLCARFLFSIINRRPSARRNSQLSLSRYSSQMIVLV